MLKRLISEYWSDDGLLKAEVINEGASQRDCGTDWVYFYRDGELVKKETYEGRSLYYYEDAAENYVMGIKDL